MSYLFSYSRIASFALLIALNGCGSDDSEGDPMSSGGQGGSSGEDSGVTDSGNTGGQAGGSQDGSIGIDLDGGVGSDAPIDNSNCDPNLTGLVRDFKAAEEPGGHPDFQVFVGNSASTGIVEPMLGSDLKPVYAHSGPFTDPVNGQQTTSKEAFDQWYRDTDGVNLSKEFTLMLTKGPNGVSTYESLEFFPIDGELFGNYQAHENGLHNYHFTFELHTEFIYNGGEVFTFKGDDDLWVFINGQLAIDLGGLHGQLEQQVALDEIASEFGLEAGQTYPLDLFHAERRIEHSRFRIDTSIEFTNCDPIIVPK